MTIRQHKDINKAQKNIFTKNTNVERILPTSSALKQHVRLYSRKLHLVSVTSTKSTYSFTFKLGMENWRQLLWATVDLMLARLVKNWYHVVKAAKKVCKCKRSKLDCTRLCASKGKCEIAVWIVNHLLKYIWTKSTTPLLDYVC